MKTINVLDLTRKLLERYGAVHPKIEEYHGLLAYYALALAAEAGNNENYLQIVKDYLALYPDKYAHPNYNFECYRVGGNGKAWLLYKGYTPEAEALIRQYAELTLQAPADEDGILCWPHDNIKHGIWIDVVACITPFMLFAGLALQEEKYIDFAAQQCFKMYEVFLDETNGLLHQSKRFMPNRKRISADHWSRGNGWGLIGLAELVCHLPADSKHRPKAEAYLIDMMEALLPHQTERGLWRQEIPEPLAWEESSGTGLILYAMGIALRQGLLSDNKYKEAFVKGIDGLAAYCLADDFSTHRSCPGCLCPGEGEEKGSVKAYLTEKIPRVDEPHSYSALMLAFVEAYKNGITEVTIQGKVLS